MYYPYQFSNHNPYAYQQQVGPPVPTPTTQQQQQPTPNEPKETPPQTQPTLALQRKKRCEWTSRETVILCQVWPPFYGKLKKASTKNKNLIWMEIFQKFLDEAETDKELEQLKNKTRALEKEFKEIKARMDRTGAEGALRIKEKMIDTYDLLDQYLSERDSVNPDRMNIISSGLVNEQLVADMLPDDCDIEQEENTSNDSKELVDVNKPKAPKNPKKRKSTDDVYELLKVSVENQSKNNQIMQGAANDLRNGMVEQANVLVSGFKDVMKTLMENKQKK